VNINATGGGLAQSALLGLSAHGESSPIPNYPIRGAICESQGVRTSVTCLKKPSFIELCLRQGKDEERGEDRGGKTRGTGIGGRSFRQGMHQWESERQLGQQTRLLWPSGEGGVVEKDAGSKYKGKSWRPETIKIVVGTKRGIPRKG